MVLKKLLQVFTEVCGGLDVRNWPHKISGVCGFIGVADQKGAGC